MKRIIRTTLPLSLSVGGLVMLPLSEAGEPDSARMEQRVKVVAAMLSERPAGFGRPVADRAAWEALAGRASYREVIPRAEKCLAEPIPEQPDDLYLDFSRTGNRTRWQTVCSQRRGRVTTLVLAECLENKGRFLPGLEEIVRALCAERTWVMPAHDRKLANFKGESIDIDLASSALAWNLAMADYLLGEKISPETRQLLRDHVARWVLAPYRDMAAGKRKMDGWMKTTNNWNAVCLAGVTGAALALVEPREERAFFIAAAEEYSKNLLRGFPPDGYCTEGLGYWNYGFGHYVLLSEAICQVTSGGVDLMAREEALAPAKFGAGIEIINGVYPAFADCSVAATPSPALMHFISRRYRLGLRKWEDYDPIVPHGALFEAMMYSFPNSAAKTPPAEKTVVDLDLRTWFSDAGILIGRPGKGSACRLGVALKGGHNAEHHNHNDVGSYVAVVGAQAVLLDPGSEVYTARTFSKDRYVSKVLNSYGHPVPIVAGELQCTGRQAEGQVVRTEFTDEADTLVLDLRSAYKVEGLKKLERTFTYSRKDAGALTVTDEVAFDAPKAFGTALITLGRWKQLDNGSLLIYDTEEAVRVDIQAGGAEFGIDAEEIHEDVKARALPTRLGINLKQPAATASITVRITPFSQPSGELLRNGGFEEGQWAWRIPKDGIGALSTEQASGGKWSLKIVDQSTKKGSSISSARIPVNGGEVFDLRGKVFPVSGKGVGVYVRYLDKEEKPIAGKAGGNDDPVGLLSLGGSTRKWEPFSCRLDAPRDAAFLQVWIHSGNASQVEAYLDDLELIPGT